MVCMSRVSNRSFEKYVTKTAPESPGAGPLGGILCTYSRTKAAPARTLLPHEREVLHPLPDARTPAQGPVGISRSGRSQSHYATRRSARGDCGAGAEFRVRYQGHQDFTVVASALSTRQFVEIDFE